LRGKILNVEKATTKKMLDSEVPQTIVGSLGAGFGDSFNIEDCRYDKIIIFTDADADGYHIKSLLLTFFYRYMPDLIRKGYVYSAIPPLYRIIKSDNSSVYLADDAALRDYRQKHQNEKYTLNRFKGLGEMNPEQLREAAMDPKTRTLKRITIDDAEAAEEALNILMGSEVDKRREFIDANAFSVDLTSI